MDVLPFFISLTSSTRPTHFVGLTPVLRVYDTATPTQFNVLRM